MTGLGENAASGLKIVGVGGAGSNALAYLYAKSQETGAFQEADFIAMNTDEGSLATNPCPHKVYLGLDGFHEGRPPLGEVAVEQNEDSIVEALCGASHLVLIAGMGGNTGTFAAPLIAKIAKDRGCYVTAMAITPFAFEGEKRMAKAEDGLHKLPEAADTMFEFSNDDLLKTASRNTTMDEAFQLAYDVIYDVMNEEVSKVESGS